MKYRISDISKLLSIPSSTLRYYDKEGLLPSLEKNKKGARMFTEKDIDFLYSINCLKKAGMTIKDIKEFLILVEKGDSTIEQRYEMFLKKREDIINQINHFREILEFLEYKVWFYETAKKRGSTQEVSNIPTEDLPKNIISTKEIIEAKKEILNKVKTI